VAPNGCGGMIALRDVKKTMWVVPGKRNIVYYWYVPSGIDCRVAKKVGRRDSIDYSAPLIQVNEIDNLAM